MTDIRMVGHSNGGDRLYLGILKAVENGTFKYQDQDGNIQSRVRVQFYGTPSLTKNISGSANNAGAGYDPTYLHIINSGDFVGNVLGLNAGSATQAISSIVKAPLLFVPSLSPHSSYYCEGSFCKFDQIKK
jgi:hypothetical protein